MEYKCRICGGICDPGELENGVCFDCRKEALKRKDDYEFGIRKELNQLIQSKIREQRGGQKVMRMM